MDILSYVRLQDGATELKNPTHQQLFSETSILSGPTIARLRQSATSSVQLGNSPSAGSPQHGAEGDSADSLESLPDDILLNILSRLPRSDLLHAAEASSRLHDFALQASLFQRLPIAVTAIIYLCQNSMHSVPCLLALFCCLLSKANALFNR